MAGYLLLADLKRAVDDQIWFRYVQQEDGVPEIRIEDSVGTPVKTIDGLGDRPEGTYESRSRAIFWNRRDAVDARVAAGIHWAALYIDSVKYDFIKLTLP